MSHNDEQNQKWTEELREQNRKWTEELREMIRKKRIAVVIGSGVSKATNPDAPMWNDLVASGIDRCAGLGMSPDECEFFRFGVSKKRLSTLLPAAEAVHNKLSENRGGELTAWLRSHFEELEPHDDRRELITALAALDAPLLTTNYDSLIERVTGLRHTTWHRQNDAIRAIRGEDRRVLHLHGFWEESESVVLGVKSVVYT